MSLSLSVSRSIAIPAPTNQTHFVLTSILRRCRKWWLFFFLPSFLFLSSSLLPTIPLSSFLRSSLPDSLSFFPLLPLLYCSLYLSWLFTIAAAAAATKSLQLCPTLCDPSPPGCCIPGILQARTLEWVAISFSNVCMHAKSLQSCLTPCDPTDSSLPGPSVHRIPQARTPEWVAISFSNSL